MGDANAPASIPPIRRAGFMFQGRIAEDFKLSTGTWVRVGPLRAALLAALGDLVQDVVIAAPERDDVRVLVFPNARRLPAMAGAPRDAPVADVLGARRPCAQTFADALAAFSAAQRRQLDARRARAAARRAAVDRRRRDHRQRFAQPEGRAAAPRARSSTRSTAVRRRG